MEKVRFVIFSGSGNLPSCILLKIIDICAIDSTEYAIIDINNLQELLNVKKSVGCNIIVDDYIPGEIRDWAKSMGAEYSILIHDACIE